MSDAAPPPPAKFTLKVSSEALPSSDARWRTQVEGLLGDLKRNGAEVTKQITPVEGAKGGTEAILLALGSSGAIAAAVRVFQLWLARSDDRVIDIDGEVEGRKVQLRITGKNISEGTLRQALKLGAG